MSDLTVTRTITVTDPAGVHARTAVAIALAGCAADMSGRPSSPAEETPYVGVFTGEYVDGKPLFSKSGDRLRRLAPAETTSGEAVFELHP